MANKTKVPDKLKPVIRITTEDIRAVFPEQSERKAQKWLDENRRPIQLKGLFTWTFKRKLSLPHSKS